jgi:hypothetical protein
MGRAKYMESACCTWIVTSPWLTDTMTLVFKARVFLHFDPGVVTDAPPRTSSRSSPAGVFLEDQNETNLLLNSNIAQTSCNCVSNVDSKRFTRNQLTATFEDILISSQLHLSRPWNRLILKSAMTTQNQRRFAFDVIVMARDGMQES